MHIRSLIPLFVGAALMVSVPGGANLSIGPERVVSNEDFDEYLPQAAYNSTRDEYLVVWHDSSPVQSRAVMGMRVDGTGAGIVEFVIAFDDAPPKDNVQPTVAYDPVNDRYLVAWVKDYYGDGSDWDVYGRIIPWDGPSPSFLAFDISSLTTHQWNPRAAYAGTPGEFLVTWWNEASGGVASYVSAQRVSTSGGRIGSNFLVTSGPEERVAPDIAYNQARNEYLIVYQLMDAGLGNIYGVRISGTGAILGGGDFGIAVWPAAETRPRVAASRVADEWAVVWQSDVPGFMKDVYARRLWVDGAAGDEQFAAPVHLDFTIVDERNPDIAAHPENSQYLIAWEQQFSNSSGPFGIAAQTLDSWDTLGDLFFLRQVVAGHPVDSTRPEIAAARSDWLVTWEQQRDDTPSYLDIHDRLVQGSFFFDGFETGDMSRWSFHTP